GRLRRMRAAARGRPGVQRVRAEAQRDAVAPSRPRLDSRAMPYLLALASALLYGAGDFTGGLAARRAATLPVIVLSQLSGLVLLIILLPFLPAAAPSRADLLWGALAGLTGGVGVALLYHGLAIGRMAVVAPTTAV